MRLSTSMRLPAGGPAGEAAAGGGGMSMYGTGTGTAAAAGAGQPAALRFIMSLP